MEPHVSRVDAIAAALVAAHRRARPFIAVAEQGPVTLTEAYAVQDAVAAQLYPARRPAAWKVGAPRRDVEPTATPLFNLERSPAHWSGRPIVEFTIEAEVGFTLARDIAAADLPGLVLDDAFERVHATIEVCDARLSNYRDAPALWKLADSQVNAGLVVGSGRAAREVDDYARVRCEVRVDGRTVFDAAGTHALGDPRVLLGWWLRHATQRATLRAGDIVTTGTWCGMVEVPAGATISTRMTGIGEAEVRFDA